MYELTDVEPSTRNDRRWHCVIVSFPLGASIRWQDKKRTARKRCMYFSTSLCASNGIAFLRNTRLLERNTTHAAIVDLGDGGVSSFGAVLLVPAAAFDTTIPPSMDSSSLGSEAVSLETAEASAL